MARIQLRDIGDRANPMSFLGKQTRHLSTELLESTDVVQKGLAKIGPDNQIISTITGKEIPGSSNLSSALNAIRGLQAEEISVFTGIPGLDFPQLEQNKVLSEMVSNINLGLSGVLPTGLDPSLQNKQLEMVKFNFSGTSKSTAEALTINIPAMMGVERSNIAPGLLSTRDGSATLLSFRYLEDGNYKYLTGEETMSLTNRFQAGFFNVSEIVKKFSASSDDQTNVAYKVGGFFQKADKRLTASTSPRNFVIGQDEVDTILDQVGRRMPKKFSGVGPKTLSESFLTYDARLESVLKGFGLEERYSQGVLSSITDPLERLAMERQREGTRIVMRPLSEDYLSGTLRQYMGGEENYQKFGQIVKESLNKDPGSFNIKKISKILLDRSEDMSLSESERASYNLMAKSFDEFKRVTDGSSFLGSGFFEKHGQELIAKIKRGEQQLEPARMSGMDPEAVQKLKASVSEWKKQLSVFADPSGKIKSLDDQTLRLLLEGDGGQVKAVADILDTETTRLLEKIGYLRSRF